MKLMACTYLLFACFWALANNLSLFQHLCAKEHRMLLACILPSTTAEYRVLFKAKKQLDLKHCLLFTDFNHVYRFGFYSSCTS